MVILGLYRDNRKENGNYYSVLGLYGKLSARSLTRTLNPTPHDQKCRKPWKYATLVYSGHADFVPYGSND